MTSFAKERAEENMGKETIGKVREKAKEKMREMGLEGR